MKYLWKQARTEIKQLEEIVKILRKEVVSEQVKYETDKEELERETGWHVRTVGRNGRQTRHQKLLLHR